MPGISISVVSVSGSQQETHVDIPPLIPGLFLWCDASDVTLLYQDSSMKVPVVSDGDVVGALQDRSGNGRHIRQPITSKKPIYRVGVQNGLSVLEFGGVSRNIVVSPSSEHVVGVCRINGVWTIPRSPAEIEFLGEQVMYTYLSDDNRLILEKYLKEKWAL